MPGTSISVYVGTTNALLNLLAATIRPSITIDNQVAPLPPLLIPRQRVASAYEKLLCEINRS